MNINIEHLQQQLRDHPDVAWKLGRWLFDHIAGPWHVDENDSTAQIRGTLAPGSTTVDVVVYEYGKHGNAIAWSWRVYPPGDCDLDPHGEGYATVELAKAAADEWLRMHGYILVDRCEAEERKP